MAISVGEIEAVLKLRDEMSAQVKQTFANVQGSVNEFIGSFRGPLDNALAGGLDSIAKFGGAVGKTITEFVENPMKAAREMIVGLLDGLGPLGVGLGALGAAFIALGVAIYEAGAKVFEFIHGVAEAEDHMQDMSLKAGASVEAFSRLAYAVRAAGGDMNMVANAMFIFDRNVADKPEKVADGFAKLGLSLAGVMAMDPADRFETIGKAIAEMSNTQERNSAIAEIFNVRIGRELVPTFEKLAFAMEKTRGIDPISAEAAHQAEEFNATVTALQIKFERLAQTIGEQLITAFNALSRIGVIDVGIRAIISIVDPGGAWSILAQVAKGQLGYAADTADVLAGVKVPDPKMNFDPKKSPANAAFKAGEDSRQFGPLTAVSVDEGRALADLNKTLHEHEAARKAAQKAAEEFAATLRQVKIDEAGYAGVLRDLQPTTIAQVEYDIQHGVALDKIAKIYGINIEYVKVFKEHLDGEAKSHDAAWKETEKHVRELENYEKIASKSVLSSLPGEIPSLQTAGGTYQPIASAIPDMHGLEHDAGVSTVFDEIGTGLKTSLGGLNDIFRSAFEGGGGLGGAITSFAVNIGKTLLSAIPVVGPFLSQFAGAIVGGLKKLFGGPSKDELAGRDVEKKFQDQFGSFSEMMAAVGKAYEATGRSAQQAQDDVKRLMDAEKLGAEEAKKAAKVIQTAFDEQKQDAADLDKAIKKYGFSIDELGPAMRRQKLTEQAVGLENDFRLLAGSGIDVKVVIDRMGSAIGDFVKTAMRTGTEVPAEMRPMLQMMVDAGKLFDQNGNKIDDLDKSGITFSETMTQGFDRVVKALDKLLAGLGLIPEAAKKAADGIGGVAGASDRLVGPSGPRVAPGAGVPDVPEAHWGAMVSAGNVIPFRRMHGGGIWGKSTDEVLAMLQDGEAIIRKPAVDKLGAGFMSAVNSGDMRSIAASVRGNSGGDSGSSVFVLEVDGVQFGRAIHKTIERGGKYPPKIARTLSKHVRVG